MFVVMLGLPILALVEVGGFSGVADVEARRAAYISVVWSVVYSVGRGSWLAELDPPTGTQTVLAVC